MKKISNNKIILVAEFLYPHLIHLPLPYNGMVDKHNLRGIVHINEHRLGVSVHDIGNKINFTNDERLFVLENGLEHKFDDAKVFFFGVVSNEYIDSLRKSDDTMGDISHFASGSPAGFCFEHDHDGSRFRITHSRYFSLVRVIWKTKRKDEYTDDDFNRAKDIFDVFLTDYRNISGDLYARLLRDIAEPRLERIFYYEGDDIPAGPLTINAFAGYREFKGMKDRTTMSVGDERVAQKAPNEIVEPLSKILVNEKDNFAGELLDEARVTLNTKRDFKKALLDSFFAMELAVDDYVSKTKILRGISKQTLSSLNPIKNFTYMLKTEIPLIIGNFDAKWHKIIDNCLVTKEIRNDVVHRGHRPTEEEAKQAVARATELLIALREEEDARTFPNTP